MEPKHSLEAQLVILEATGEVTKEQASELFERTLSKEDALRQAEDNIRHNLAMVIKKRQQMAALVVRARKLKDSVGA